MGHDLQFGAVNRIAQARELYVRSQFDAAVEELGWTDIVRMELVPNSPECL